ncbi:sulfur oxidation protein soxB [Rhodopirellula maiorica SM1]|uniref:Sulfur oxidation protein soxB n=1 Tax=Rhodopirellula maiorica SM1 TaxID=1265738 RepID=M5RIF5_9BACT|nr:5'-nucleotidase C-terminal domain-containing protein [Rhodopirellula maiorica]EMI19080.1 sulfur oxidation protein soxB [Rhodopirellula maiorica SM1]
MKMIRGTAINLLGYVAMAGVVLADDLHSNTAGNSEENVKKFSIAFVNDIHAQLEPHPELYWNNDDAQREMRAGGLSRIKTAFDRLADERPHGILKVDGGDTFQGSGPAAWTEGEVMVRPLNALGFDVAIPGNWSVVYGADRLRTLRDQVNYPMIAANIYDKDSGERTFQPTLVKEMGGVKVGLVGFTDPDVPSRQPPFMSEGLKFSAAKELQPLIDGLREDDEVDVVVLISHIGLHKAVPLTEKLRGVDIHLSADTHERTYDPIVVGDAWVVEAGAFGALVGVMDVSVRDGKVVDRKWELIELRENAYPEDEQIKKIVDEELAPHRERMNREIGHTDIWLERYNVMTSSMDRLIANAVKETADVDVGLSNGYRFSPPTAPGPITEADLWNWLPINLDLKTGIVKGQQFIDYWESEFENVFSFNPDRLYGGWLARPSTNMQVRFDSTAAAGERLRSLTIDGDPVEPDKDYTLAAGSRPGQPESQIHRVKGCRATKTMKETTHDAVREYLAKPEHAGKSEVASEPKSTDAKMTLSESALSESPVQCVVRGDQLRSQFQTFVEERQKARQKHKLKDQSPDTTEN